MKLRTFAIASLALVAANVGITQDAPPSYPQRDPAQLDQLLSPIALYPDPLLGAILPASTHPAQLASAASLVASQPDPNFLAQQPWDDSVKALAQYNSVIEWMAQNQEWTNELGAAVLDQQQDVLASVQRLRANARASGMLTDTPQQHVVMSGNVISIEPAQSDVVYVPEYDPQYLESPPSSASVALQFGPSFTIRTGPRFNLDWRDRSVWIDRGENRRHSWFSRSTREEWRPAPTSNRRPELTVHTEAGRPTRPARFDSRRAQERVITPTGRGPSVIYGREQEQRTYPEQRENYGHRNNGNRENGRYENRRRDRRDDDDRREDAPDR